MRTLSIGLCALCLISCSGSSKDYNNEPIAVDDSHDAFVEAAEIALSLRDGAVGKEFPVQVRLVDDYGREELVPVVTLAWLDEDLRLVEWSGFTKSQMANLAKVRIDNTRGVIAFAEWCADYTALTPRLCSAERERSETNWALSH